MSNLIEKENLNQDENKLYHEELITQLNLLKNSDERFQIAAENSSEIILDYNLLDDSIYHVTNRVTEIYGIPQYVENAPEELVLSGAILPEHAKVYQNAIQQLKDGEMKVQCILKTCTITGETRWIQIILTGMLDKTGRPYRAIGVLKDITPQHIAELQYEKELLHRDVLVKEALLYYEVNLTERKILTGIQPILAAMGMPYIDDYEYCLNIILQQMVYPEDQPYLNSVYTIDNLLAQHRAGLDKVEAEYRRLAPDGKTTWVRGTAYMTEDAESNSVRAYYYVYDINEAKLREMKLQQQVKHDNFPSSDTKYSKEKDKYMTNLDAFTRDTALYDALALSTDDYIFICDVPKDLFYIPKAMATEFDLPGQIVEHLVPLWAELIHENERGDFLQDIENMFSGKTDSHCQEYRVKDVHGNWVWMRCRGHIEHDEKGEPTIFAGVITNLGKKHKIDYVSGLLDRYEFELYTQNVLADTHDSGALLLLGLDNFKHLNTFYSWEFGDQVLRATGQCIQELLPSTCRLYRLEGDMFGAFFPNVTAEEVEAIFKTIFCSFQNQQICGGKKYYVTVSGGCTTFEAGGVLSFTALLKQAECALEYAKKEGKNCLYFYDSKLMSDKEHMLALTQYLQESIENDFKGFEMYLQPQIIPDTRTVLSAEALLRWQCPELGRIPPIQFIPILEQTGLIHKVGRWVLEAAAGQVKEWQRILPGFTISVNLSFIQLQDKSFPSYVIELVNSGYLDPALIHMELTESCITLGSKSLIPVFQFLRDLGFQLEMDDFGTGYSSLEILKNAPADVVKIDHAFVREITNSEFDATFIRFVVALCHSVDIKVCLEGVETWEEFELVKSMNLDLIQGFLFGRPMPVEEFRDQFLPGGKNFLPNK